MEISKEITIKLQELQLLERNLQTMAMEKQSFQVELNEIENALSELNNSGEEVYKILNGIMIKSTKEVISKDLSEKKNILTLRLSSIEKNEAPMEEKAEKLRSEINTVMSDNK